MGTPASFEDIAIRLNGLREELKARLVQHAALWAAKNGVADAPEEGPSFVVVIVFPNVWAFDEALHFQRGVRFGKGRRAEPGSAVVAAWPKDDAGVPDGLVGLLVPEDHPTRTAYVLSPSGELTEALLLIEEE